MLTINHSLHRFGRINAFHHWFHQTPASRDACRLAFYYHCSATRHVPGFVRVPKFTKVIDLTQSEEQITAGYNKSTRYEVRRAERENLEFAVGAEQDEFCRFYNEFAVSKGFDQMNGQELDRYWPHVQILKSCHQGEPLVMHAYLMDEEAGRGLMLHSASHFRNQDDNQAKRLVGRANRHLHHQAILWMRERGIRTYDFGGYAKDTQDKQLQAINRFKDNFGGQLIEESNYLSLALVTLRGFKQFLSAGLRRR